MACSLTVPDICTTAFDSLFPFHIKYLAVLFKTPRAICMAKCEVDYSSVDMRRVCETAFVDSIVFLLSV